MAGAAVCVHACTAGTDPNHVTRIVASPAFWPGLGLAIVALAIWVWVRWCDRDGMQILFEPDDDFWEDE